MCIPTYVYMCVHVKECAHALRCVRCVCCVCEVCCLYEVCGVREVCELYVYFKSCLRGGDGGDGRRDSRRGERAQEGLGTMFHADHAPRPGSTLQRQGLQGDSMVPKAAMAFSEKSPSQDRLVSQALPSSLTRCSDLRSLPQMCPAWHQHSEPLPPFSFPVVRPVSRNTNGSENTDTTA